MNFFVTGLPRSRTAWFANYFTSGDVFCWHEAMNGITSKDEYYARMSDPRYRLIGNADSGLYLGGYIEGCPLVVIERDVDEVNDGLKAKGFYGCRDILLEEQAALADMGGLHVDYYDIPKRLGEIHEYCIDTPYDELRGIQLMNMNVQLQSIEPDMVAMKVWEDC